MLIFDGHLDLALNALGHERNLRDGIDEVRAREAGGVEDGRGVCTVTLPAVRSGGVAVVISTLIARCKPWIDPARRIARADLDYPYPSMAYAAAQGELAYYRLLEAQGELTIIASAAQLDRHVNRWASGETSLIGMILTMEGADPIVDPEQVHRWHAAGLRTLMLAHFGQSRYAAGTPSTDDGHAHDVDGPITDLGARLLAEMALLKMPLDLSHLSDQSFASAADAFEGQVYSSHSTCRALVPGGAYLHPMRMHTDEQIRLLVERGGVIGVTMFNAHLAAGYQPPPDSEPDSVSFAHVADHVDHICQLAGSARHVAIGSDLDGGFGAEHTPRELDTIADLGGLEPMLADRGYGDADRAGFFGGNWLRFWGEHLP